MEPLNHVLLIEPDPKLATIICGWLKNYAQVVCVTDEENARKQVVLPHWNLVITAINSPNINGLEITQIVKKTNSSTAILIVGENIKIDFILTAMKYHADGLFFKPLDENEFTASVLRLIDEVKLKRKLNKKIILAIGAHPDDTEIGCGGTLMKMKAEGNDVNILTLSLGGFGGDPNIRKKEAEAAAKLQGAELFLGDFCDTKIVSSLETIQFIESIVQHIQPTHVYTHSFNDSHQDHRSVYQATVTACRQIPNLFSYLSPSATVDFRPNIFISIDNYIDDKLQSLAVYASQKDNRPYLHPEMIKATARYWGRFCNYGMVEPMEVIKERS